MSRFVSDDGAALLAAVDYDIAALCVGERLYGAENSAAFVCTVTGVYINVQRAKAKWTVVSRRVAEREHLLAAIFTNKTVIVFSKSFSFHKTSFSNAEF